jgi:hypothetical protein
MNLFDYPLELEETAQRHRRNLLVTGTVIGFVAATPGMTLSDLRVFGLSLEEASTNWVWGGAIGFLIYFCFTYWTDVSWCWAKWSVNAYPLFGGKLKGLFGFVITIPTIHAPNLLGMKKLFVRYHLTEDRAKKDTHETVEEATKRLRKINEGDTFQLVTVSSSHETVLGAQGKQHTKEIPTLTITRATTSPPTGSGVPIIIETAMLKKFRRHVLVFIFWQASLPLLMGIFAIYLCFGAMDESSTERHALYPTLEYHI